jgi:tetratricopeptide (TPR) repeat protein
MKHSKFLRKGMMAYMIPCILMVSVSASLSAGEVMEPAIFNAYQLRVNGKADQAEELLRQYIKTDTTDAIAWFELARTRHHILLGKGPFSPGDWKEVLNYSKKSVRFAPENEVFAYYYAYCCLLDAFISMMQGQQDAKDKATVACASFQSVLELNPRCYAAKLYLIDVYGMVPEEMGGDKTRAVAIAEGMKSQESTYYAMAQARLLPDTTNLVLYWQKVAKDAGMNAQVMEELGRAFLLKSDSENGEKYFMDAIQSDPSKKYLIMNLVRYHAMMAQQDQANKEAHLKSATDLVNNYLQSDPELIPPLKAYAYNALSMISMFKGDQAAQEKYGEMAASLDPYCSKASGMPPDMLYSPPDKVKIQYSSFFMPF